MDRRLALRAAFVLGLALLLAALVVRGPVVRGDGPQDVPRSHPSGAFDRTIEANADAMMEGGRNTFRFDTFGDESLWGDTLGLHRAIEGQKFGGVGPGLSPRDALGLGLKVDVAALPSNLVGQLRKGRVDLDDPAVTLALLKLDAVVGVTGFFNKDGSLKTFGIQCALCHSTVDNSLTFGIGHRLDGWANRDLDIGAIIASAPNLAPVANLLGVPVPALRAVLNGWGPGKFDAEVLLDGKAVRPDGAPAATLLPNAFGLAGFNQHTWTGGWGTVPYWNALVANIEMGGKGVFYDPRLNSPQFPIVAKTGSWNSRVGPDDDRITSKLPALQFYQLAIPAPKPRPGVDFDPEGADRGDKLFEGKADCNRCHVEPLWTEPGWNVHTASEMKIDSFEADRSPARSYKTMNLAGLFVRENGQFMRPENAGRYYHDGRFRTLLDVVKSYNDRFALGLTLDEMLDLVEYLKSL